MCPPSKFPCKNVTSGEKFAPWGSSFDGGCEQGNVALGPGGRDFDTECHCSSITLVNRPQSAEFSCQNALD